MLTVRCSIIDGLFLMYAIDIFSIRVVWPFFKFGWKRKLKNAKGRRLIFIKRARLHIFEHNKTFTIDSACNF